MVYFLLVLSVIPASLGVDESDITLYFYDNRNLISPFYNFTLYDSSCDISFEVDLRKGIIAYIHGWESQFKDIELNLMYTLIKTQTNSTIIRVNYPYYELYTESFTLVKDYGKYLGNFFKCLNRVYNYSLDNVRLICHSLGAHICGVAGRTCDGRLASIIGLDPAGPIFDVVNHNHYLTETTAKIVEVIHTSNVAGTVITRGTSEFYINKGLVQPGCKVFNVSCSHNAAIVFYTNTILYRNYTGIQCSSYISQLLEKRNSNDVAYVGQIVPDPRAKGVYLVQIDYLPPF